MQHIQTAYGLISSGKRKERFDIILEPLQAVSQISLLACCPQGTKLSIDNNLLFIQTPVWHQGLTRAWNHDRRDDVLLLFNAVQRYNKFYVTPGKEEKETKGNRILKRLTEIVTRLAIKGIDNLSNTYSRGENASIVQTLVMYKNVLMHPDRFACMEDSFEKNRDGQSIEDVFSKIRTVWSDDELEILYRTLCLMEKHPNNYDIYTQGMNTMFAPLYERIRKWMSDNIVY